MDALLSLRELTVEIPTRHTTLRPVDRVSFDIMPGEILGIVGESGAGKSMTGNAIIGLLDRPARVAEGEIRLDGRRIDNLKPEVMRKIRGKRIGMVFQDPLTSLNPLLPVGDQIAETIREHLFVSRREAENRALTALEEVGIPAARERWKSYPHEFSGGMRQRVVIALALCAEPQLVIADEPTTALDVSIQAQILLLLKQLCRNHGTAIMLITHDMGVIAETADRIAIMYAGRMVEIGPVREVISNPAHPYTAGLMASIPRAGAGNRLSQIAGSMPRLSAVPAGCAFNPRCNRASEECRRDPPPVIGSPDPRAACRHPLGRATEAV